MNKYDTIEAGDYVDIDEIMQEKPHLDYKNIVNTTSRWVAEVFDKKTKNKIGLIEGGDFGQLVLEWVEE